MYFGLCHDQRHPNRCVDDQLPTPSYFLAPGYMTSDVFTATKKSNTSLVGPKFFTPILFDYIKYSLDGQKHKFVQSSFLERFSMGRSQVVKMRGPASEQASWGVVCLEDDQYVFLNQQTRRFHKPKLLTHQKSTLTMFTAK